MRSLEQGAFLPERAFSPALEERRILLRPASSGLLEPTSPRAGLLRPQGQLLVPPLARPPLFLKLELPTPGPTFRRLAFLSKEPSTSPIPSLCSPCPLPSTSTQGEVRVGSISLVLLVSPCQEPALVLQAQPLPCLPSLELASAEAASLASPPSSPPFLMLGLLLALFKELVLTSGAALRMAHSLGAKALWRRLKQEARLELEPRPGQASSRKEVSPSLREHMASSPLASRATVVLALLLPAMGAFQAFLRVPSADTQGFLKGISGVIPFKVRLEEGVSPSAAVSEGPAGGSRRGNKIPDP